MKYGKLTGFSDLTLAPFNSDSQTKADGITRGSQIYYNPYNVVTSKQCHILLNSNQGFPRHSSYSNRNPNNSVP